MMAISVLMLLLGVAVVTLGGLDGLWIGGILIALFAVCLVVLISQWRQALRPD